MRDFKLCRSLALFLCLSASSLTMAATITRGPYLQMAADTAMTVRWRTDTNTNSVVRYGSSPGNLNQTATISGNRTNHEVRVTGLSPDTTYYYSVGSSSETVAGGDSSYRFTTSPVPGTSTPTRVWLIGDSGTADANAAAVYNAYLNSSGANNTDLWIMLGDNAYNNGTDNEYQNAVFNMYPELLRRSPLWATLGNHDGASADSGTESGPYYDIFTLPRNAEAGGLASGTEAYYSFDYGDIHFICLDSYDTSRSTGGAMVTWLQNDIAATNQKWIIAFWHHPPYTKGSHNSDTEGALIDMRQNAVPILEDFGVDLVLTGHSHSYERSFLIDGHYGSSGTFNSSHMVDSGDGREDGSGVYNKAGASANGGAVYTVAGASGKTSGGTLNHPAMYTSLNMLGSVVLDINGDRLDAKYLRSNGTVVDYYTVVKGSGSDTTPPTLTDAAATSSSNVAVAFSEAVDPTTAQNTANYSIDGGVSVSNAVVNGSSVALTTSVLSEGLIYTLTVNNVEDLSGNVIAANSQANFTYENVQTTSFQNGVFPTGTYNGSEDTYVASGAGSSNFGSETTIQADGDDGTNGELVGLIKWDVSSIASGSTVTDVQVELEVINSSSGSYDLYAAATSWNESFATWNNVNPTSNSGALIGSFNPSSTGTYTITLNSAGQSLVQDWVDGMPNNGVFIINGGTTDGVDIQSSEVGTSSERPRLIVTHTGGGGGGPGNVAPTADFGSTSNLLSVTFTDLSSDSDGFIDSWSWNFGDGNNGTLQNPIHNYAAAGTYTVTLTVTDNEGAVDSTAQQVTVSDGSSPTTVNLQQGTDGYSGAEDTYVAQGFSGNTNFGGNADLQADAFDTWWRRELITLLKWDVSSVPAGSTITDASITLQVFNQSNGAYNLLEMLATWSEGGATWNNTNPPTNSGAQIGSFTPSGTGSHTIQLNAAGIALIQSWVNGANNNGLIIESDGTSDDVDMRSSEYSNVSQRPILTISYQ